MAPRLWLWLHVATAMVAVSCTYHHERHPHTKRSHTERHNFLGNFLLNGNDSRTGSVPRPHADVLPYRAPHEDVARRRQRHRHRRRPHGPRVPDIIYSFGSQAAPKLLYRGKGYRVGPYTGYVDVWTIPRQARPLSLPPPRSTTSTPPLQQQRQRDDFPEGTAFARVLIAPERSNAVEPPSCLRCPKDRTVWVGPGFSCAEVPKPRLRPCSRLLSLPGEVHVTATMGPQPGSLVMEGVYQISFTVQAPGMVPQSCHYKLRVKVRRCPALRRPEHGSARCSRGRHWGSRCRFFCQPGYTMQERVATRCAIHDGVRVSWTPHPEPVCRAKNVSAPDTPTKPVVPSTVVSARPSTEPSIPPTRPDTPRTTKRWKQLACRWPKAPLHGWVSCDRGSERKARVVAREGTRCRQGCRWDPQGVVTHFLCVAGSWSGRKPLACSGPPVSSEPPTESGCESLPSVPNSVLECSAVSNTLGRRPVRTVCRHVCDDGFEISHSQLALARVTCLPDGTWDNQLQPQCVKSGCPSPDPVPESLLECTNDANRLGNRPTGTVCKVVCREGFTLPPTQQSINHFICHEDGTWNQTEQLQCHENGCPNPDFVPESLLDCSNDAGYLGNRPIGTTCKIMCKEGFTLPLHLESHSQFVCQENGTWNQTARVECHKNGCPNPDPVPDSSLECSNNADHLGNRPIGTACKVLCSEGFSLPLDLESRNHFICQEDGTWSQTAWLECHKNGCPNPDPVPDSSLECSNDADHLGNRPIGTACKVVCSEGFSLPLDLESRSHFICQEDGTWSQTARLECHKDGCKSLDPEPNSALECSADANHLGNQLTGTVCTVVCADGFSLPSGLQSLNQFVCQEDGSWNKTADLECRKNECPSPDEVPDSSLECSSDADDMGNRPTGTICKVVCADGFTLPSSLQPHSQFICQNDGSWNQTGQLICHKSGCPSPDSVPDSSLECTNDVNDLGNHPTGTMCKVVCTEGFTLPSSLISSGQFVCQEDGTWNQTAQLECRQSGCSNPDPVPDSALECSHDANHLGNRPTGTTCKVVCAEGFSLPSSLQSLNQLVCQEDGMWSQKAQLQCHRVTCDKPLPVLNSVVECSNGTSVDGKWSLGTVCRLTCDEGFAIPKGQEALNPFVCRGNGTWSLTEPLSCEEAGCKSPALVEDSVLSCSKESNSLGRWPAGTVCSYDCKEGYSLAKSQLPFNHFVCFEDGTWNQTEDLHCRKTGCEDPSAAQFSMVNCSGTVNSLGRWPEGTVCSHSCEDGFAIPQDQIHLNLFICLDDGSWNQTEGLHCRETGCEEPGQVRHSVLNCTLSTNALGKRPPGTLCSYSCDEGYALPAHLEPRNRFSCSEDGSWDQKEDLLCNKTGCERPRLLKSSVLDCSESANVVGNWPAGTICNHICDKGFVIPQSLQHLNEIVCLDDGKWNETDNLECVERRNPQLSQGCRDEVVVVDGHNVSFPVALEAPTFGAFNGTDATVNCSATEVAAYGTHVISCDAFDSELGTNSSCAFNVTALAPGCAPFQSDPYSRVSCSADRNATGGRLHPVGDVCEYICQQAEYVIPQSKLDSAVKECRPDGSWSDEDFHLCEKQLPPVVTSGCKDDVIHTDVLGNTTVPLPVFRTASGQLVNATCTPEKLLDYREYQINCVAEDRELRSSTTCSFKVIVKGHSGPRPLRQPQNCVDVHEVYDTYPAPVRPPAFEAASGGPALVTCEPATLLGPGAYNVTCTARDNKTKAETQCAYVVNARQIEQFRESQCLSLRGPANGDIRCKRRDGLITCHFSCFPDYVMNTTALPLLARGFVVCDRAQRDRFDFQEEYGLDALPACTRLPSPTYFQGSLAFHVGLPNCSLESLHMDFMPKVNETLFDRAGDLCRQAFCDITFVCETDVRRNASDPSSASAAMKVVWTVQARHNVNASNDIPEAEIVIEQIQVLTHYIVTSDPGFYEEIAKVGGDLWQDSFRQSRFRLVCGSRGFAIDADTAHCVQCPRGTFEEHGACHLCPLNHYQDSEGQTSCRECPKHTFSFEGAKMVEDCTEFAGPDVPPPARDAPARQPHHGRGPCDPNPCRHQGICYLQSGGYACLCQQHYRGRHCEQPA
ncbi:uncharacterized protein LOC144112799 isoform X2 [Amblyomma americanum]